MTSRGRPDGIDWRGYKVAHFGNAEIQALVKSVYGVDATVTPLPGEVDHNFMVDAVDKRFVLKISPPGGSATNARFQVALALHLAQTPVAPMIQKVVLTADGEGYRLCSIDGVDGYLVRSTTYLPGVLQCSSEASSSQHAAVGAALAAIQLALDNFSHPGATHELLWDMLQADRVCSLADDLNEERFAEPFEVLDDYLLNILPRLKMMRVQVCHNDLNGNNVLVDPKRHDVVTGILDFGDAINTAAIADVAVGAAYNLGEGAGLLDGAASFVSGFASVKPLFSEELAILPNLLIVRMAIRIIITEWRAKCAPQNSSYLLRNTPLAWTQFDQLRRRGVEFEEQILSLAS